jgi:general secretion pathway protein J
MDKDQIHQVRRRKSSSKNFFFYRPLPIANSLSPSVKGYTFIEVLVAMAIFSSMVMLATMALNQGLKQYKGLMEKGINFWDKAKYVWIDSSFSDIANYYIFTDTKDWAPYFYGDQDRISYVSLSPLAGNQPVVAWITKERKDNGSYAVVYYELPVYTKTLQDIARDYSFGDYKKGNSIVLLDDVESLSIDYYGYDLKEQKVGWSRKYDSAKMYFLPSVVKMDYTSASGKQVMYFGINANSRRKAGYEQLF